MQNKMNKTGQKNKEKMMMSGSKMPKMQIMKTHDRVGTIKEMDKMMKKHMS